MFDYEKEVQATAEEVSRDWENAEWEKITDNHASTEEASGRADARLNSEATADPSYRKVSARHRDRVCVTAIRFAMLAIGLTAVGWLVRSIPWLAITLGVIALIFGLTAAYGAGKYSEL